MGISVYLFYVPDSSYCCYCQSWLRNWETKSKPRKLARKQRPETVSCLLPLAFVLFTRYCVNFLVYFILSVNPTCSSNLCKVKITPKFLLSLMCESPSHYFLWIIFFLPCFFRVISVLPPLQYSAEQGF